jgi:hypothetical protein
MIVRKVNFEGDIAQLIPITLDNAHIGFESIGVVDWEKEYPYKPQVRFRIAHTDDAFLVNYRVTEKSVMAHYGEDNGEVWTDSCVEFFSMPGGDDLYYNIECNCIGTILLAVGKGREDRERATADVLGRVKRWSSLGREPFEERVGECTWEVALYIPYSVFFKHQITSLDGKTVRANFYKCGDKLQTPHFLSWNKIDIAQPDFHRPDFFGELEVEK